MGFISLHSDDQVLHNINRGELCVLLGYVRSEGKGGSVCFIASFDFRRMGWVRAEYIQEV